LIIGIGCDLCEIPRIEKIYQKHGQQFLQKLFNEDELNLIIENSQIIITSLAARFAAKEAFYKALPPELQNQFFWKDISILKDTRGKPYIIVQPPKDMIIRKNNWNLYLSLTHEKKYAQAFVVIESFFS